MHGVWRFLLVSFGTFIWRIDTGNFEYHVARGRVGGLWFGIGGETMSGQPKFTPVPKEDPAGLDKLLLAAGKGCARFLESLAQAKLGTPFNFWDGQDGLGAVLEEHLKSAGVPNKRLPELVTPRAVLEQAGVIRKKRAVRRLKSR
jgi:hypothetical protein